MKKALNALKGKGGYISIETVIVAGLVIALGAFAITEFYSVAQDATFVSMGKMEEALMVDVIGTPIP